jgi:hypothetical protein
VSRADTLAVEWGRIDPMKKVARLLRTHRPPVLSWFRAGSEISAGTA